MASAAARASGLPAISHNAAGLHDNTLKRNNIAPVIPDPDNVLAYRVKNEIVAGMHEPGWKTKMTLAGIAHLSSGSLGVAKSLGGSLLLNKLMPKIAGTPHELPGRWDPITRHKISEALWGIKQQNEADETTLCAATGVCCT